MFQRLRGWIREKFQLPGVSFGGPDPSAWPFAQSWVRGNFPKVGPVQEPYRQHVWTSVAIEQIADDASGVEWELFRVDQRSGKITDNVVDRHPVLDLWRQPNDFMVGTDLFNATYIHYLLEGEAWWVSPRGGFQVSREGSILRNGAGGLMVVPSSHVQTKPNDAGTGLVYTLYPDTTRERILSRDEFVQFRRYNPYNPSRGLAKFDAMATDVHADVAAAQYNRNFFSENGGMPNGLLFPDPNMPGDWTPEQRSELKEIMRQHGGTRRGWGILPKWAKIDRGSSHNEMQFPQLRDMGGKITLAGFSLPPFMAGAGDSTKFANAKAQINVYWNGTITRLLGYVANVINHDFLPKLGVTDVRAVPRWETIRALTENLEEKSQIAERWRKIGIPLDKINDRLELGVDLEGVEGADEPLVASTLRKPGEEPAAAQPAQDDEDEERETLRVV